MLAGLREAGPFWGPQSSWEKYRGERETEMAPAPTLEADSCEISG